MRKLLLPLFCCLLSIASAQDPSLFLVPRWKVGDSRTLTINTVTTETENGTATEDREVLEVKARVVNEDAKSFILRLEYDNIVLREADKLMKSTGGTSTPITKMNLRYAVDRITGKPTLQNWEEVQRVVKGSFEDVLTRMKAEHPDEAPMFGMVMLPILSVFDAQENVQAYFSDVVEHITFPYGKQMVEGDTLRIEEYGRDPFGASVDSMHVTTLMSIKRIDRWEQQAVVRGELRYDIPSFMAQMKSMMQMVVNAMTDDPQAKRKAEAEMKKGLDAMRFDVRDERLYTVDLRTTWPISSVRTGRVMMKDHERNNETTVVTTVMVGP